MNSSMRGNQPELAVLPNWLGDLVMALPALALMKQRSELVVVGAPALVEFVDDLGLADAIVSYDRRGADAGPRGLWRAARRCAVHRPYRATVFPPSLRAALLAFLAGCRRRRGHPTDGRALLLNERVPLPRPARSRHQSDVWLAMVSGEEPTDGKASFRLVPGKRGRQGWKRIQLEDAGGVLSHGEAFAVVAPGAQYGPAKRWPLRHFRALSKKIHERFGWTVVVVGGGAPAERQLCRALGDDTGMLDLCGRTDLPTLSALLAAAELFVGNDSGPAQVAAAAGTPTVTVFGSTSPRWTAPRGPASETAGPHPVPCTPCFRPTCSIGLPCLEELTVGEVWDAVERVLERAHAGRGER